MNREIKKRYKMYKAGKNWVVAPIIFLGLTAGLGYQANVNADNVSSSTKSNSESTQRSKTSSLSSQSSVSLKSSSSIQSESISRERENNFAVQPNVKSAQSSSESKNQVLAKTDNTPKANVSSQVSSKSSLASSVSSSSSSSSIQSQKVEQAQEHDDAVQIKQNGQWFLQNKNTHQNYTGFQYIKNQDKTVYYNPMNGAMVYGQQKINNQWYYFDKITGAMKLGYYWIAEQQKEVYYDPNKGNMVYGQQKINNKWQWFDPVTGAQAKNRYVWIGDQNKEVYYDGLGNMVYGQQKINNKWQWFDPVTGAQAKNRYVWIGDQNKEVYYDGLGNMVYGQQKINNKWQWFDPVTGAQAKNQFVNIKDQNKTVYYDGLGNMVYGWKTINNGNYYFNTVTGAMETYSGNELPVSYDSSSINETDGYLTYDGWFRPTQYHQDGKMWVKSGLTDWRPILMYAWPSAAVEAQYIQYFTNHGYADSSLGLTPDSVKALSGSTPVNILNNYAKNMRDSIEKQITKAKYSTTDLSNTMKGFIATVPSFTRASLLPIEDQPGFKVTNMGTDAKDQIKFVNNDSKNQKEGNTSYADSAWRLLDRNFANQKGNVKPKNDEMIVGNDIDNSNPIVQAETLNWEYYLTHYGSIHSNNPDGNFDGFRVDAPDNFDTDVLGQMAQLFNDMYHTKQSDANANDHLIYTETWDPTAAQFYKDHGQKDIYYDTYMYYDNQDALGNRPGKRGKLDELTKGGICSGYSVVDRTNDTTENQAVPNWSFVMNHDQRGDIIKQMIIDEHPNDPDVMSTGYKQAYADEAMDQFVKDEGQTVKKYAPYNVPSEYAVLLTDKDTIPTIYYGDLYVENAPYMSEKSLYYDAISTLLKLRKKYVSGGQQMRTYDNGDLLSSVRFGKGVMSANDTSSDPIARTSGIAVVIGNNPNMSQKTITFAMGKEHANQKYINVINTTNSGLSYNSNDVLTTDANGNLTVTVKGYANPYVSGYLGVWVPEGAAEDQNATTAASTATNKSGDTYQSNAALDSHVIYQDFSLYIPEPASQSVDTYAQIAKNAQQFADLGITDFWFAPPYRNFSMSWYNEGYSVTDRYDLGSANNPTKYGTGDQLVAAIAALHKAGLKCQIDLVPNQLVGLAGKEVVTGTRTDSFGHQMTFGDKSVVDQLIEMYTIGGGQGQEQYGGAFLNYLKKTYPDLFTTKAISTGVAPDPNVKIKQWSAKYENGATLQDLGTVLFMREANGTYDYLNSNGNTAFATTLPKAMTDIQYWVQNSAQPGWHTYGNAKYYINQNGSMALGHQTIDGQSYYFDPSSGKLISISNTDGQRYVNGHWQYIDPNTKKQAKNQYVWLADQNKEVYYDGNGNMVYGQQKIDGKWQYFDPATGAQAKNQYVWIADQNKEVYYDGLGNMVYGQQKINGKWQYFNLVTGAQARNQYVWIGDQNKEVYYDGNGNMAYGWQTIDGKRQYFDPITGAQVKSATVKIDGKWYKFDGLGNLIG